MNQHTKFDQNPTIHVWVILGGKFVEICVACLSELGEPIYTKFGDVRAQGPTIDAPKLETRCLIRCFVSTPQRLKGQILHLHILHNNNDDDNNNKKLKLSANQKDK